MISPIKANDYSKKSANLRHNIHFFSIIRKGSNKKQKGDCRKTENHAAPPAFARRRRNSSFPPAHSTVRRVRFRRTCPSRVTPSSTTVYVPGMSAV